MAAQESRLTRSQEHSLSAICAIGESGLRRVADRLDQTGLLISRAKIESEIVGQVGQDHGTELARFLSGIAIGFRQDSSAPEATLNRISDLLGQLPEPDDRFSSWQSCLPLLVRLLASPSIRLAAKALEISYDFERLYQTARFITTLRPVFDEEREEILGGTIVQTLRLEFVSSSGEQSTLSMALDRGDIEQLRRSCDEALRKADAVLAKASGPWQLPTIVPGQD
jgi:hypothetical protein